jgi:hypothetical protein
LAVDVFSGAAEGAFAGNATALIARLIPGSSGGEKGDRHRRNRRAVRRPGRDRHRQNKGYRVKVVEFSDYVQPNFALAQGALDANAFQHFVYPTKFATENKVQIVELIKVQTAPIALYSYKHKTLEVKEGAVVALPNDPTNAARALVVLQDLG